MAVALPRGCGLRGDEHHVAIDRDLGRQRQRHHPETRDFFHWLSGLIVLPAAAFAGQPFFRSAIRALRARSLNMDVPISIGVLLALTMSVFEMARHAEHAYFDSAIMLLVFLLAGR